MRDRPQDFRPPWGAAEAWGVAREGVTSANARLWRLLWVAVTVAPLHPDERRGEAHKDRRMRDHGER